MEILLDPEPFASGGEGNLYRVRQPAQYQRFVAKLYHQDKRTDRRRNKIEYLVKNPPLDLLQGGSNVHQSVIWPLGMLFEKSGFAGFLMPFAQGQKLEILSIPRIPRKFQSKWGRFDLKRPEAVSLRLKICFNIAAAVFQLHETNHYVLVDLKTDNVIIQPNGLISIVDMDSIEVIEEDKVLFPALVTTPEFAPPEYYRDIKPGKVPIKESWDRFSCAIIFYKLLFGIHPFAGSSLAPYDKYTSLDQKIEHGLFVHNSKMQSYFKVIPPPHLNFKKLPSVIQELFVRCFEDGHDSPERRPDADEWCWAISPRPRMVTDRILPSKEANLKRVSYSKSLELSPTYKATLPAIYQPKLPALPTVQIQNKYTVPRLVTFGTLGFMAVWIIGRGMPFNLMTLAQVGSLVLTNLIILFTHYFDLPEVKNKRLVNRKNKLLRRARTRQKRLVERLKSKSKKLPNREKLLIKSFDQQQQQRLITEKKNIEGIVKEYRRFLSEKDKIGREYIQQEFEAVQQLEKELIGDALADYRNLMRLPTAEQIKWLEKDKVKRLAILEEQYKVQLAEVKVKSKSYKKDLEAEIGKEETRKIKALQAKIATMLTDKNREQNRILKMLRSRFQAALQQHLIENSRVEIFGNGREVEEVIKHLHSNGINDAGDFIAIDLHGRLQKFTDRRFRIIPHLTKQRAEKLNAWRLKIVKSLGGKPNVIPADAKKALDIKYATDELRAKLFNVKKIMLDKKVNLPDESDRLVDLLEMEEKIDLDYQTQKDNIAEDINEKIQLLETATKVIQAKKEAIKLKFDGLHEVLLEDTKKRLEVINKEIEIVNGKTQTENQFLKETTIQKINASSSSREVKEFLNLSQEVESLRQIEKDFAASKQESASYEQVNFEQYLRKTAFLR